MWVHICFFTRNKFSDHGVLETSKNEVLRCFQRTPEQLLAMFWVVAVCLTPFSRSGLDPGLSRGLTNLSILEMDQVVIAQWLAQWLATGVEPGSNPGKGENLLITD